MMIMKNSNDDDDDDDDDNNNNDYNSNPSTNHPKYKHFTNWPTNKPTNQASYELTSLFLPPPPSPHPTPVSVFLALLCVALAALVSAYPVSDSEGEWPRPVMFFFQFSSFYLFKMIENTRRISALIEAIHWNLWLLVSTKVRIKQYNIKKTLIYL